jgi:hypothetical protein
LVHLPLFDLLYQPWMIDDDACVAVGGMRIGKGNRSTRTECALKSLSPSQIHMIRPGIEPVPCVGKPANNLRSYGVAECRPKYVFLISPVNGVGWPSPHPSRFMFGEDPLFTMERRMNESNSRSRRYGERKISCPCCKSNPNSSRVQMAA